MGKINFTKMHGCGNDYIILDGQHMKDYRKLAILLTDRHKSIGADGVAFVLPPTHKGAIARMRVFNADGSEALMCGNSIRCVGKYLYDQQRMTGHQLTIQTESGIKSIDLLETDGRITAATVHMGEVVLTPSHIPTTLTGDRVVARQVTLGGNPYSITALSLGTPHGIIFTDDLDHFPIQRVGELLESSGIFPEGVNLGVVEMVARDHLRMGLYERGTGQTKASGTGACAGAVAAVLMGYSDQDTDISVKLEGGTLSCAYIGNQVHLTGEAITAYEGVIDL